MNKLARYHPLRFAQTRPYAKKAALKVQGMQGMNDGIPTHAALETVLEIVMDSHHEALSKLPLEERGNEPRIAMKEADYTLVHAMFCKAGRNIFDIDPILVDMFHHTDVGEIPLKTIKAPFENLYLHFGPQQSLSIFDGQAVIEGAYVILLPELLQVYLSTRRVDGKIPDTIGTQDFYYYLPIPMESESITVREALTRAIDNEVKAQLPSNEWRDVFTQAKAEAAVHGIHLTNSRGDSSKAAQEEVLDGANAFISAMNLVMNSLCYLTAYQSDIETEWPEEAPESLTRKAESGKTEKERKRAESKLLPLGFTKIRFCRVMTNSDQASGRNEEIKPVRAHWRRGHWRNQPVGPKDNKAHQLKWIRPTYVGKGDSSAISGHLYSVNPSES